MLMELSVLFIGILLFDGLLGLPGAVAFAISAIILIVIGKFRSAGR